MMVHKLYTLEEFRFKEHQEKAMSELDEQGIDLIAQVDVDEESGWHSLILGMHKFSELCGDVSAIAVQAEEFHDAFNKAFSNRDVSEFDESLKHFYDLCATMIRNKQSDCFYTSITPEGEYDFSVVK